MFSNVIDFAKTLYAIFQLETGPQKLPSSLPLLVVSLILYVLCQLWVKTFDYPVGAAGFLGVFDAVLLVLMASVPLLLLKRSDRILQTVTALACVGIAVSLVDVFLLFLLSDSPLPVPEERMDGLISFLTFPVLLWRLLMNTTLLRYALSWGFTSAFALAVGHLVVVGFVGGALTSSLAG